MNAQTSFGSQPQYRPQAASAQIGPGDQRAERPDREREGVQPEGQPLQGRRGRDPGGQRVREPALARSRTRCASGTAPPVTKPSRKTPEATDDRDDVDDQPVRVERRHQRADRRVEQQPVDAEQHHHGQRHEQAQVAQRWARRTSTTSQPTAATNVPARMNSYMLPHGTRSAARPRATSETPWTAIATSVTTTAARPARAPGSAGRPRPRPAGDGRRLGDRRDPAGGSATATDRRRRTAPAPRRPARATRPGPRRPGRRTRTRRRSTSSPPGRPGSPPPAAGRTVPPSRFSSRPSSTSRAELVGESGIVGARQPTGLQQSTTVPSETIQGGRRRKNTRRRRPDSENSSPISTSTAPTSTIFCPGSCRTDTVTYGSVPEELHRRPSSSVHVSPGRSSLPSPTSFSEPCATCAWSSW